jgi:hypothetical protein
MGPMTRGGRAKVAGTKRRKMYKDIEDTVSEAMTPKRSFMERLSDFSTDMVERANEAREEAYGTKKFALGGEVEVRPGDVRDNPKRGQCY